jgi:hypothetical protein
MGAHVELVGRGPSAHEARSRYGPRQAPARRTDS